MAQHVTRPQRVKADIRREFVLDLRCSGKSYRAIAEAAIAHFGIERLPKSYNYRQAWRDVDTELRRIAKETSADARVLRAQEIDRLDRMLDAVWPFAMDPIEIEDAPPVPNLGAIDRVLRIAERRSKLLGLDMPTRVDYTDVSEEEIERLAEEWLAGQLAAARESQGDAGSGSEDGAGDAPEVA